MTADDPRVQRAREHCSSAPMGRAPYGETWREYYCMVCSEAWPCPVAELLDVVDELRRWKSDAAEVMLGLQDLGKVLGVPYGTRITGKSSVEAAEALWDRLDAAEYERDQLLVRAGVERARAEKAEAKLDDHHRTRTNQPWEER